MKTSLPAILSAYSFKDKIEMLMVSKYKNDFNFTLTGYRYFNPIRNMDEENKLDIIEAKWLNGRENLAWINPPSMKTEGAFDDLVWVKFDLRDFKITVQMQDEGFLSRLDPRCQWVIQGNAKLFKSMVEGHMDRRLMLMLEQAYEQELEDARHQAMTRICASMHQNISQDKKSQ